MSDIVSAILERMTKAERDEDFYFCMKVLGRGARQRGNHWARFRIVYARS
ncbi:MAG TPA: hypothetical protein VGM94_00620 [Galbitalea sp.]|jgi:hypothetical protein